MAAAPDAFAVTIADLRIFLMPLVVGLNEERICVARQSGWKRVIQIVAREIWPPSGPWSPGVAIDEA